MIELMITGIVASLVIVQTFSDSITCTQHSTNKSCAMHCYIRVYGLEEIRDLEREIESYEFCDGCR